MNEDKNSDPVALYQENQSLTNFFIKKYFPRVQYGTFLYEELLAEARVGLWDAATKYNPEKSKFSTYAGMFIHGYLTKYYTRVYKKQLLYFDNSIDFSPENCDNASIGDLLISDNDTENSAIDNIIHEKIQTTVKSKYSILEMYYLQEMTQLEIAKVINRGQMTVSRKIKDELQQIEKELKLA